MQESSAPRQDYELDSGPQARHDVALYAPFAGPYLCDPPKPGSGGAELQMTLLGRELAAAGLRVCQVVYPDPDLPRESHGVHVLQRSAPLLGGARGRLAEAWEVWRVLHRAGARAYVHRGAGPEVGVSSAYCRVAGRRFVYSSSSTLDWNHGMLSRRADQLMFEAGARMADAVAVQSAEQVALARAMLGPAARIEEIPSIAEPAEPARSRDHFLWAGAATEVKNPLAYIDLARAVPEARFVMAAAAKPGVPRAIPFDRLREAARELPNLDLREAVPRADLGELMAGSVAIVNTSPAEGMPNVFLEAWQRGVPVLSLTVDPDGIIARHGLGAVAGGSPTQLADAARLLWAGRDAPGATADRVRGYVSGRHGAAAVVPRWLELIEPSGG